MSTFPLSSRIDRVKVFASGARVTRVAEIPSGCSAEEFELSDLPLALDDRSVRAQLSTGTESGAVVDIRVGLSFSEDRLGPEENLDQALTQAKAEVLRQTTLQELISAEIAYLQQLTVPQRPTPEPGKAPPPSPFGSRLAITAFKDEQIRLKTQEKREILTALRQARAEVNRLEQQLSQASNISAEDLKKTLWVRCHGIGSSSIQLSVEYFISGAGWAPTYQCWLDTSTGQAIVFLQASVWQQTGEDWLDVELELSTAEPLQWCELPELPALRIGQTQPRPQQPKPIPFLSGEHLFQDYDQYRTRTHHEVIDPAVEGRLTVPSLEPLQPTTQIPSGKKRSYFGSLRSVESLTGAATSLQDLPVGEDVVVAGSPEDLWDDNELAAWSGTLPAAPAPTPGSAAPGTRRPARVSSPQVFKARQVEHSSLEQYGISYAQFRLEDPDKSQQRGQLSLLSLEHYYSERLLNRTRLESIIHRTTPRSDTQQDHNLVLFIHQVLLSIYRTTTSKIYSGTHTPEINLRQAAGNFDFAYPAEGRSDILSNGQKYIVTLGHQQTHVDLRYVIVPREKPHAYRIANLRSPFRSPLLTGSMDVYADGDYILSTSLPTLPEQGQFQLGWGVEQGIKIARNTTYWESRSNESLVSLNELHHQVQIEIANRLGRTIQLEVRERIPIPEPEAKVAVRLESVDPDWEPYDQKEREASLEGGYCWQLSLDAHSSTTLQFHYVISVFSDHELAQGNRREQ